MGCHVLKNGCVSQLKHLIISKIFASEEVGNLDNPLLAYFQKQEYISNYD